MLLETIHFTMSSLILSWLEERIVHKDDLAWLGLPDLRILKPIGKDFEVRLLLLTAHHVADFYLRSVGVSRYSLLFHGFLW